MDWITANWLTALPIARSRMTTTRVVCGASSFSSSSHLALVLNSNVEKPVTLPPGCARLPTKPAPTGSVTLVNTIGTVLVACCSATMASVVEARMTSGACATNSAAYLRRSTSLAPHRISNCMLRRSVQPYCCSPFRKAERRSCPSRSSACRCIRTPIRRIGPACCPIAVIGHVAAPPSRATSSRRFNWSNCIGAPQRGWRSSTEPVANVREPPKTDRKSGLVADARCQ